MRYLMLKPAGSVMQYLTRQKQMINIIIAISHHLHAEKGILPVAIKYAIERGRPKDAIIQTVFDNIIDNESYMISILSKETVRDIKTFHHQYFKPIMNYQFRLRMAAAFARMAVMPKPAAAEKSESKSYIVALKYHPHSDHHFIEFSDHAGIVISTLITKGVATGLSRSLKINIT